MSMAGTESKTNKKEIKKYVFILVTTILLCFLTGCNNEKNTEKENIRVGSLKGPTSMGLMFLMEKNEKGQSEKDYEFTMATGADEILAQMMQKQLDVALVPANVASVLYKKSQGEICVVDINTLGVLYLVTGDESVQGVSDLSDKTVYLTGKGTTPDYVLQYLLKVNGVESCSPEYKSEASEVSNILLQNPKETALLPQPFAMVTVLKSQKALKMISMNDAWEQSGNGSMVTGVTIVRKEFLNEHKDMIDIFIKEHKESVDQILADPQAGAALCVKYGIVADEKIAKEAIPMCNITCITGGEMKDALEGYLAVLYEMAPESVGDALHGADFYYCDWKE